jgi:hypothetical protein
MHSALGYPVGGTSDYVLYIYVPSREGDGCVSNSSSAWRNNKVSTNNLRNALGKCENRLQKLITLVEEDATTCIVLQEHEDLEEWVHDSANMVVLGDAAHPSVVRSFCVNTTATVILHMLNSPA